MAHVYISWFNLFVFTVFICLFSNSYYCAFVLIPICLIYLFACSFGSNFVLSYILLMIKLLFKWCSINTFSFDLIQFHQINSFNSFVGKCGSHTAIKVKKKRNTGSPKSIPHCFLQQRSSYSLKGHSLKVSCIYANYTALPGGNEDVCAPEGLLAKNHSVVS